MAKSAYMIYVETFGKVQSGTKIENKDYKTGSVEFTEWGKIAIALAAFDTKKQIMLRTQSGFNEKVRRLLK